jgi:Zn-dependent alcohol dehydrogenase
MSAAVRDTFGGNADIVIDAVGDVELAASLEETTGQNGTLVAYGVPASGSKHSDRWETARVEEHESYSWVARMASTGVLDLDAFLSHTWYFADVEQLVTEVTARRVLKAIVRF